MGRIVNTGRQRKSCDATFQIQINPNRARDWTSDVRLGTRSPFCIIPLSGRFCEKVSNMTRMLLASLTVENRISSLRRLVMRVLWGPVQTPSSVGGMVKG